jgi:hypothetical protein
MTFVIYENDEDEQGTQSNIEVWTDPFTELSRIQYELPQEFLADIKKLGQRNSKNESATVLEIGPSDGSETIDLLDIMGEQKESRGAIFAIEYNERQVAAFQRNQSLVNRMYQNRIDIFCAQGNGWYFDDVLKDNHNMDIKGDKFPGFDLITAFNSLPLAVHQVAKQSSPEHASELIQYFLKTAILSIKEGGMIMLCAGPTAMKLQKLNDKLTLKPGDVVETKFRYLDRQGSYEVLSAESRVWDIWLDELQKLEEFEYLGETKEIQRSISEVNTAMNLFNIVPNISVEE